MTIAEDRPATPVPSGAGPSGGPPKYSGTDDTCSYLEFDVLLMREVRCLRIATDTVKGKMYCSPHADEVAGL